MKRKFLSLGSNPPRSKLQFWFIKPFSTALPILSIKLLPSPSRPQISELANESGPHAAALVVVAAGCAVQVGTLETWRWAATGILFVCPFKGRTLKITGHILHFLHLLPYGILTFFFFFLFVVVVFSCSTESRSTTPAEPLRRQPGTTAHISTSAPLRQTLVQI